MKRLAILLCFTATSLLHVYADDQYIVNVNGVGWVLTHEYDYEEEQHFLVVAGCTNHFASMTIPKSFNTYMGKEDVRKIGSEAFARKANLQTISIPESVREIGDHAFRNCSNLRAVSVSGSALEVIDEGAFFCCSNLCDVSLPESVKSIGRLAFYACAGLTSLILPDALEDVGEKSFLSCSNLDIDQMPSHLKTIGLSAFAGTGIKKLELSADLEELGGNSFSFCNNLTSVKIDASIDSILGGTFSSCINLKSVIVAADIKNICENAFAGDLNLTSIELPDTLVTIGEEAFRNCNLKSLSLPVSLETVGRSAFSLCNKIETLYVFSKNLTVEDGDLCEASQIVLGSGFTNFELLHGRDACIKVDDIFVQDGMKALPASAFASVWCDSITLPKSVTTIGGNAFYDCRATNVIIKGSVSLGESAFAESWVRDLNLSCRDKTIPAQAFYCASLSNLVLSSSVERIEKGAFYGCAALENLTWPEELKFIGESAFAGCESLTNLNLEATHVAEIGKQAFFACTKLLNPVAMPVTLKKIDDQAFYGAVIWKNLSAVSDCAPTDSTIQFRGLPPTVGNDVFAVSYKYGDTWYVYNSIYLGKYEEEYAEEWEKAIEDWSDENETEGKWAWLEFYPEIVVESVAWEMDSQKSGGQSLTIGWHLPTNETYTIEQAMKDILKKDVQYAVWRSMDNPQSLDDATNFLKAVCIKQNVAETNYVDETFGKIPGVRPVCYWVEVQHEKNVAGAAANREHPDIEPAMCMTRRRFALAIGLSRYNGTTQKAKPVGGFEKDTLEFVRLLKASGGVADTEMNRDVVELYNQGAEIADISNAIATFPYGDGVARFVPGDIAFLWIATHGVCVENSARGAICAYDDDYYIESFQRDLAWVKKIAGVRFVGILPFCYAAKMYSGFDHLDNVAWIAATRTDEQSTLWDSETQFGRYFLRFGWSEGIAYRTSLDYCESDNVKYMDVSKEIGSLDGKLTFLELAKYTRCLAVGRSWRDSTQPKKSNPVEGVGNPSHLQIVNGSILDTVVVREMDGVIPASQVKDFRFDVEELNLGMILIKYDTSDNRALLREDEDFILWFRRDGSQHWRWVSGGSLRDVRDKIKQGLTFYPEIKLFGSGTVDEYNEIGIVLANQKYEFRMQTIHKFGYGEFEAGLFSNLTAETGDLGTARSRYANWLAQPGGATYTTRVGNSTLNISAVKDGVGYTITASIDSEVVASAFVADIDEEGILSFGEVTGRGYTLSDVRLSLGGASGTLNGQSFTASLEIELQEDDAGDATVYGPYVLGENVSIAFTNGAMWQVTGLPAGLKWDAALPGVTGVPTELGTNTVWFSWTDTTGASNVERKVSATFIVVEKVAGYQPEIEGDCDDVSQDGAAVGQTVRMYTFDEKTEGPTNWVCTGWIGTGDVPAMGTSNEVSFVVKDCGTIRWLYQTNYWVQVEVEKVGGGGEIGGSVALYDAEGLRVHGNSGWFAAGTNLTAEATANAGWLFAGWRTVDAESSPRQEEDASSIRRGGDAASTCAFAVCTPLFLRAEFVGNAYAVRFETTGGTGAMDHQIFTYGKVYKLPPCEAIPPAKKRFAGWACSNGRCYDDGVLVFNLAKPGETVTMTAIWE